MESLKWFKAVVVMTTFVGVGYVTACAGGTNTGGGNERIDEAAEAIGEACTLNIGSSGGYSCPGAIFNYQSAACCTEGTNYVCRDINNDSSNCGSCGNACNLGVWCRGGTCCGVDSHGVHKGDCNHNDGRGTCETLLNTDSDCGFCGRSCDSGTTGKHCTNYACQCTSGQTDCSGTCKSLQTDNNNCGSCGHACNVAGGEFCSGGSCVCPLGQTDCSGTCKSLQSDTSNCGACGTVCGTAHTTSSTCSSGVCQLTCAAGWADGDHNPSNGCEYDLSNSGIVDTSVVSSCSQHSCAPDEQSSDIDSGDMCNGSCPAFVPVTACGKGFFGTVCLNNMSGCGTGGRPVAVYTPCSPPISCPDGETRRIVCFYPTP